MGGDRQGDPGEGERRGAPAPLCSIIRTLSSMEGRGPSVDRKAHRSEPGEPSSPRLSTALDRLRRPPFASRTQLGSLVAVFLVSRFIGAFLAGSPQVYSGSLLPVTMDPQLYDEWAGQVLDVGQVPYADVRIEYPPGALPFILLPSVVAPSQPYLLGFVAEMFLVDAVGLFGLMILARRWGSRLGPWLWVLALPLLGPLSWARLDIVPAVATIWVIVAADTTRWAAVGGLIAFGALTKVYPVFLLRLHGRSPSVAVLSRSAS